MNGKYRIVVRQSVLRDIRKWPQTVVEHLRAALLLLAENPFPHGVEKMQGYEHLYRLRVGRYRIVYHVDRGVLIITVVKIGHRKDIYRNL